MLRDYVHWHKATKYSKILHEKAGAFLVNGIQLVKLEFMKYLDALIIKKA